MCLDLLDVGVEAARIHDLASDVFADVARQDVEHFVFRTLRAARQQLAVRADVGMVLLCLG